MCIYTHIYIHTHIPKYPEFFFLGAFSGIYLYISLEEDSKQDSQSGWQLALTETPWASWENLSPPDQPTHSMSHFS